MLRVGSMLLARPLRASSVLLRRYPHSHSHSGGHSHAHGSTQLLQSSDWRNPGVRITWVGLFANIGMAVGKGVGGVVFHSQSLLADAVHAVADLFSDFLTLATIKFTKRPPSASFPYGYGRVEAMGTLGVSALLVYAGFSMGFTSLLTVIEAVFGHVTAIEWLSMLGHGHSHGPGQVAEWSAAGIAVASIVVKEALFQVTKQIGEKQKSSVLIANAWHHRVDSLASVVAAVSIAGGKLLNVYWLDPLGSLIVSIMILRAGWGPAKQSMKQLIGSNQELMESDAAHEFETKAHTTLQSINPAFKIVDYRLIPYGPTYVAYIHLDEVESQGTITLKEADAVATQLQHDLLHDDEDLKDVYVTIGRSNVQ